MSMITLGKWRRRAWWTYPVLVFFLVGFAWALSNPPGAAPDEPSHFVRVIGMGRGQIVGGKLADDTKTGPFPPEQLIRINREAGYFTSPGSLPEPDPCNAFNLAKPFACPQPKAVAGTITQISFHAKYLPLPYIVPGILSRLGSTTWRALFAGRIGFLLQDTVFAGVIIGAIARRQRSLDGVGVSLLLISATPLVGFLAGTLAPSGTEILSTVAFAASFAAAVATRSSRWWWISATMGVCACWSRDLGAPLAAFFGILALVLYPDSRRWVAQRFRSRDVYAVVIVIVAAIGATIWQAIFKDPGTPKWQGFNQLWLDIGQVPQMLIDSIGLIGWVDVQTDPLLKHLWEIAWLVTIAVAVARATPKLRAIFASLVFVYVVANLYIIYSLRAVGFGDQARFTLAIPLGAAVLLAMESTGTGNWGWFRVTALVAAFGQFSTMLLNAHRHANGEAVAIDFKHVAWSPPGGWTFSLVLYVVIALMILWPAALPYRRSSATDRPPILDPSDQTPVDSINRATTVDPADRDEDLIPI